MKPVILNLGALTAGLLSSAIVVALISGLQTLTSFNLFSLMVWLVVPVGAFITGGLAASGYYFGALKLHAKPTKILGIGMVLVAALTQLALYQARYHLDTTSDGQHVDELIGFPEYTAWILSHARYGLSTYGRAIGDGVEVGFMGYAIAALQLVALLVGGFSVYAILADRAYCDTCSRYARQGEKREVMLGGDDAEAALAELRQHAPLSPDYLAWLAVPDRGGTVALDLNVFECPKCQRRAVYEQPKLLREGKWSYQGALYRTVWAAPPNEAQAA